MPRQAFGRQGGGHTNPFTLCNGYSPKRGNEGRRAIQYGARALAAAGERWLRSGQGHAVQAPKGRGHGMTLANAAAADGADQADAFPAGSDTAAASRLADPGPRLAGGLEALCAAARLHQISASPAALRHTLGLGTRATPGAQELIVAASHLGLRAAWQRPAADRLRYLPLPAVAPLRQGHVVLLARCDGQQVLVQWFEPGADGPDCTPQAAAVTEDADRLAVWSMAEFVAQWSGDLLALAPQGQARAGPSRFDLGWFIPSLVRHRRLILEVLLLSAVLQVLAMAAPLISQVVMDKVLVHRALATLDILVIATAAVMVFEAGLGLLRSYLLAHTSHRVDVELGSRLFRHLLDLPLAFFHSRRAGDTVARVRELESIRGFLTGPALTALIDVPFTLVFLGLMWAYSPSLTAVVLASVPVYVGWSLWIVPLLRSRLDHKFACHAECQSNLVEAVQGVETIKASALGPQVCRRWDAQLAALATASFRVQTLAQVGQEGMQFVSKAVQAALLWFGAQAVMRGELTLGMFVAFNMFASRVSAPVLRLAQLWTEFQQVGVSMRRLADVLDLPGEGPAGTHGAVPALAGRIQFENVHFRYRPDAAPVLRGIDLDIPAGSVVGFVGRSGSGKSTLAKLIQRLHVPEQGHVRVDGMDVGLLDAGQLRRQMGVVLQENFLFNRSIRENIAIGDPAAPLEPVRAAAQLAGADEFIQRLPQGYDTPLGEQGIGLSGGQRQRIAIARALFTNPRILILDEATSALDYESEAALQSRMADICRGRTVVIVAHRLSALRHAQCIHVIDQGCLRESGTHEDLLQMTGGLYAHLWHLQHGPRGPGGPEVRA